MARWPERAGLNEPAESPGDWVLEEAEGSYPSAPSGFLLKRGQPLARTGTADTFTARPLRINAVASKSSSTVNPAATTTTFSEWISGAIEQGVKPEQALAVVGLGLMRGMASTGAELPLLELDAEVEGTATVSNLKGRLEAISLAVQTGAPLTTQEVTLLLGARPGTAVVRRAGITAQRLSRNVWQLSRTSDERSTTSVGFSDGFRRRL